MNGDGFVPRQRHWKLAWPAPVPLTRHKSESHDHPGVLAKMLAPLATILSRYAATR
jgi:hypothetical protein